MYRPRIIPILLLKNNGLVKTKKFDKKNARYIGDPINAVKVFNDLKCDELIFLDIEASNSETVISTDLVRKIGDEAFMPFSVGGGITKIEQVDELLKSGAEKVIINSSAINNIDLIKQISNKYGSQSIIVCIDIKKDFFKRNRIYTNGGRKKIKSDIIELLKELEDAGIGEIMVQSIVDDGMMNGYNLNLLSLVSKNSTVPVIAAGGCSSLKNMKEAYDTTNVNALAAGSLFVYHGPRNAVLINYPSREDINNLFK
tara:strand:+ start:2181 stop:2948 length:768 start_codon:yes stop_codon:yes gene_type:complete